MEHYGIAIDLQGNANKGMHELHDKMKELGKFALAGFGIAGGIDTIKKSVEAYWELENAQVKVKTALKSTGYAAGMTFGQISEGAGKLSSVTLFHKEQILDAQSMLLTFTGIKKAIFEEAIPAIADFATRFKMDLPAASNMVGKALNSPLIGMNRLQRMGVMFSDTQKNMIKNFMATNQTAKAQQVIVDELKTEFGGLSEAMAQTHEGKWKMALKQIKEAQEELGKSFADLLVTLAPMIEGFFKGLSRVIKNVQLMFEDDKTGEDKGFFSEGFKDQIEEIKKEQKYDPHSIFGDKGNEKLKDAFARQGLHEKFAELKVLMEGAGIKTHDINTAERGNWNMMSRVIKNLDPSLKNKDVYKMSLDEIMQHYMKMQKKKPGDSPGLGEDGKNLSKLGGASGGLGEAKVINIRIENMLRINAENVDKGVLEKDGQLTVEELIRILNDVGSVTVKM